MTEQAENTAVSESALNTDDLIFALDIGTRSVIGVVGSMKGEKFRIAAVETIEHEKRAMIDGQIEDIGEVASVAARVKAALEQQLGIELHHVCVAAAGRALKTHTAEFSLTVSPKEPISRERVYELEMGAVSRASEAVAEAESSLDFYCVGYSVKRFYLDDYAYSTILGHKGKKASAEVIATFLPREVVESLATAMSRIGLEIDFLTLEPIAAMNAVIPHELRLLNLALVDIGAGTSDIALCEENCVTAYTMATVAGDEITEEIIRHFLVDFNTAERMKHSLSNKENDIPYSDIMGFDYTVTKAELLEAISGAIDNLSRVICDKIVECNGHSPAAVFLVGGGSKIPTLCSLVAQKLDIEARKVAVGGNNFMKRVVIANKELCGPEYATPLGIAITAATSEERHGFSVTINGERRPLFRSSSLTLMDVLLLCGYKYSDILGKNGKNIEYDLNGKRCIARGSHLVPAVLRVNGENVSLSARVNNGDELEITPAQCGENARVALSQLMPSAERFSISYDGTAVEAGCKGTVNGQIQPPDYEIQNRDAVVIEQLLTLGDLYDHMGVSPQRATLLVNGSVCPLDYRLKEGDRIAYFGVVIKPKAAPAAANDAPAGKKAQKKQREAEPADENATGEQPPFDEPAEPAAEEVKAESPAAEADEASDDKVGVPVKKMAELSDEEIKAMTGSITVTINGKKRVLPPKEDGTAYMFVDMFNIVDIDPTKPQGNIALMHNKAPASYLQAIKNGDSVEIYWTERRKLK